jgi:RNA polymerase sigma-70 factor, ECF subfamily
MGPFLSTPNADSDSGTIVSLKLRDPAGLADLYDRYGRRVYSVVFRILGNVEDAEDVVQEVFLKVWTRADQIDPSIGVLAPWLLTIARNLAVDHFRSTRSRGRFIRQAPYDEGHDLVPTALSSQFSASIDRLQTFTSLPREQRQVMEFAYFQGMSQAEISERVGKPLGTVKTWVRMALCKLRKGRCIQPPQESLQRVPSCRRALETADRGRTT